MRTLCVVLVDIGSLLAGRSCAFECELGFLRDFRTNPPRQCIIFRVLKHRLTWQQKTPLDYTGVAGQLSLMVRALIETLKSWRVEQGNNFPTYLLSYPPQSSKKFSKVLVKFFFFFALTLLTKDYTLLCSDNETKKFRPLFKSIVTRY